MLTALGGFIFGIIAAGVSVYTAIKSARKTELIGLRDNVKNLTGENRLLRKELDILSDRYDLSRDQINDLRDQLRNRDAEIRRLNDVIQEWIGSHQTE